MMTTTLSDCELNIPLENSQLQQLLEEVREKSGRNWQVTKRSFFRRRVFRKPIESTFYSVYLEVGGCMPYQLLNFYKGEGRYGTFISESELACYLMGMVDGLDSAQKAKESYQG